MEQETPLASLWPSKCAQNQRKCIRGGKADNTLENYKGTPRACRDAVRKPEAQFKLKLARDVKNHIEEYFRYVNTKQKEEGNTGLVFNSRGELVTNETEKAKVLNIFSSSVFTSTVGLQALGKKPRLVRVGTHGPTVREERVCMSSVTAAWPSMINEP